MATVMTKLAQTRLAQLERMVDLAERELPDLNREGVTLVQHCIFFFGLDAIRADSAPALVHALWARAQQLQPAVEDECIPDPPAAKAAGGRLS